MDKAVFGALWDGFLGSCKSWHEAALVVTTTPPTNPYAVVVGSWRGSSKHSLVAVLSLWAYLCILQVRGVYAPKKKIDCFSLMIKFVLLTADCICLEKNKTREQGL